MLECRMSTVGRKWSAKGSLGTMIAVVEEVAESEVESVEELMAEPNKAGK